MSSKAKTGDADIVFDDCSLNAAFSVFDGEGGTTVDERLARLQSEEKVITLKLR